MIVFSHSNHIKALRLDFVSLKAGSKFQAMAYFIRPESSKYGKYDLAYRQRLKFVSLNYQSKANVNN